MKNKTTFEKTNIFDWLAIQLLRQNERNVDSLEFPLIDAEKDEFGRLVRPDEFLAERADLLLPRFAGVTKKALRQTTSAMFYGSCVFIVVLGIVLYPLAWANSILDGRNVNLAGPFVYFLIGQLFFLILSFVFIALTILFSFLAWIVPKKRSSRLSKIADLFVCFSAIVGSSIISLTRRISLKLSKFGKKRDERSEIEATREGISSSSQASLEKRVDRMSLFFDCLFKNRRTLLFWGSLLTHLFWLTTSIGVFIVLTAKMQGNRYDYCWETSLGNENQIQYFTERLGTPFRSFAPIPDLDDVFWLLGNSSLSKSDEDVRLGKGGLIFKIDEGVSDQSSRSTWSWFLLNVVLLYCVVPRFLLAYFYWLLFLRSLKDFRPDLKDEYFARLIEREENYATRTKSEKIFDDDGDREENQNGEFYPCREAFLNERDDFDSDDERRREANRDSFLKPADSQTEFERSIERPSERPTERLELPNVSERTSPLVVVGVSILGNVSESTGFDASNANYFFASIPLENRPNSDFAKAVVVASESNSENVGNRSGDVDSSTTIVDSARERLILAFGYDAAISETTWRELFGNSDRLILFGDVVESSSAKRDFMRWFEKNASNVEKCVVLTDHSLPPAKQLILFLQDDLLGRLKSIPFFLVLSCGERLRKKFHNDYSSVSERVDDWKRVVSNLKQKSRANVQAVFFDHELNIGAAKARLRQILNFDGDVVDPATKRTFWNDSSFQKMDRAFSIVFDETATIFKSGLPFDEEIERERLQYCYEKLLQIYREENELLTEKSRRKFWETSGGEESFLANAQNVLSNLTPNVDFQSVKDSILPAASVWEQTKRFCSRLSPKCALAMASIGASLPVALTLAPVAAGTASLAVLTGALSSLLPSVAVSGAAGALVGSTLPNSLLLFKEKFKGKFRRLNPFSGKEPSANDDGSIPKSNEAANACFEENVLKINSFVSVSATWIAIFELQRFSEETIVAKLPIVLSPVERSSLDSIDEITAVLECVKSEIKEVGKEMQ